MRAHSDHVSFPRVLRHQLVTHVIEAPAIPMTHRVYLEVLEPCFAGQEDFDDLEALETYLRWNVNTERRKQGRYFILALSLRDRPVAATMYAVLRCRGFLLLKAEYLAVRPELRGEGLGRLLCEAREAHSMRIAGEMGSTGLKLAVVYSRDSDAQLSDAPSRQRGTNALGRFWRSAGYHRVEFPYVQLPVADGRQPVRHLVMWLKTWSSTVTPGGEVPAETLHDIIAASNYYRTSKGDNTDYPAFHEMVAWIVQRGSASLY